MAGSQIVREEGGCRQLYLTSSESFEVKGNKKRGLRLIRLVGSNEGFFSMMVTSTCFRWKGKMQFKSI